MRGESTGLERCNERSTRRAGGELPLAQDEGSPAQTDDYEGRGRQVAQGARAGGIFCVNWIGSLLAIFVCATFGHPVLPRDRQKSTSLRPADPPLLHIVCRVCPFLSAAMSAAVASARVSFESISPGKARVSVSVKKVDI